jgi:uncharacterized membrane protein
MRAPLLQFWERLRSSYWFIPSLMCAGAFGLGVLMPMVDHWVGDDWIEELSWIYANKPEGARDLLSTVAGSMISVAGVTFSITIVAVSHAAGQYGPRLLTNFLRDRGNQFTLGTFLATFLYSLIVLRTVRGLDEDDGGIFVPHIALLGALAFALASIGVLIYFIHHTSQSIHISNVVAGIGKALTRGVERLFPKPLGQPPPGARQRGSEETDTHDAERNTVARQVPDDLFAQAEAVKADGAGYIQAIDEDGLLETAREHDLVLRLLYRPGDFVSDGKVLVLATPAAKVDDDVARSLRRAFAWGWRRTPVQDVPFLADELVEIAGRALSTGINDPPTATSCLDWIGAAMARMAGRDQPSGLRFDEEGHLRIVTEPASFAKFADATFGQLRPYVRRDRNAALHTFAVIGEVAEFASADEREVLRRHADALLEGCEAELGQETDRQEVRDRHRTLLRVLTGRDDFTDEAHRTAWLGGSA